MKLKNITSIFIQFNPYASNSVAARAFLSLISSDKSRLTNPKCDIKTVLTLANETPKLLITYSDGIKTDLDMAKMKLKQIVGDVDFNNSRFPEDE